MMCREPNQSHPRVFTALTKPAIVIVDICEGFGSLVGSLRHREDRRTPCLALGEVQFVSLLACVRRRPVFFPVRILVEKQRSEGSSDLRQA
jgi:hypothetical protein